jgi:hypothetical protein
VASKLRQLPRSPRVVHDRSVTAKKKISQKREHWKDDEAYFQEAIVEVKEVLRNNTDPVATTTLRLLSESMRAIADAYKQLRKHAVKHGYRVERHGNWAGSGYSAFRQGLFLHDYRRSFDLLYRAARTEMPRTIHENKKRTEPNRFDYIDPLDAIKARLVAPKK